MAYLFPDLFILVFGLCIGSFLNVCICRIPESESIINPPSSCPKCGSRIKPYDNIPVISYILLKGRCRNCNAPVSVRYPAVEIITGLCALAVYLKFGLTIEAPVFFFFISTLIVITFIDIDHQIIPDIISLPGIVIFFLLSFITPAITFYQSLAGIFAGGGSLYLIALIYSLLTKKEGMGGGDIKLLAMMGALIGLKGVLFTIFVSSATGTLIGVTLILIKGKNMRFAIPFGPFLSIGAILYIFFGNEIINWYFSLL